MPLNSGNRMLLNLVLGIFLVILRQFVSYLGKHWSDLRRNFTRLWTRKLPSRKLPLKCGSHMVKVWTFRLLSL